MVSSAVETEIGDIHTNCQVIIPIRHMLKVLGHQQPPTPVKTENSTASSYANNKLKMK